ncbi:MAG: type IX secretion system PorP/SprF family membrane protein [Flavobacteriales bacterium]|jgi:type IX secretion system PorP/SprF family membrane protein
MKTRIIIALICLTGVTANAQQDVQFTNFNLYKPFYNPGALIETDDICGSVIARNQWSGFGGNPQSFLMNVGYKISDNHTAGLNILSDELGQQHSNLVKLGYAYRHQLLSGLQIGAGFNISWFQSRWGGSYITPDTAPIDDLSIPDGGVQSSVLDVDAGLFLQKDGLYVGLSSSHLNQGQFTSTSHSASNFSFDSKRHYYIVAGYQVGSIIGDLRPSLFVKSDGASTQLDVQVKDWIQQKYMVGLNYRLGASIDPMIGYMHAFGTCTVSAQYSYGIITNQISQYTSGTHEFGIHFCYKKPVFRTRSVNPRWLGSY